MSEDTDYNLAAFFTEDQLAEIRRPLRWMLKHKPKFVTRPDGTTGMQIHPEDAHLFDEVSIEEPVK